jgi:hypothetical protein
LGLQIQNKISPNQILALRNLRQENVNVPNVGGHALRCLISQDSLIASIARFQLEIVYEMFNCQISTRIVYESKLKEFA